MKKSIAILLILTLAVSLTSCTYDIRDIGEIPIVKSGGTSYSVSALEASAKELADVFSYMYSGVLGQAPDLDELLDISRRVIQNMQARGVSEENMQSAIRHISRSEDLLASLLLAIKGEAPIPYDKSISLFGELCAVIGTDEVCLLLYDLTGIYFSYNAKEYYEKYKKFPQNSYIRDKMYSWRGYVDSFKNVGEENFTYLIKLLIATASLKGLRDGGAQSFFTNLSAGEVKMLLNTEGKMLSKLSLDDADIEFIYKYLSEDTKSLIFAGIAAGGDLDMYREKTNSLLRLLSSALENAEIGAAEALLNMNISGFLHSLFSSLDEGERAELLSLIKGESEAENYKAFLEKRGLWDDYLEFSKNEGCSDAEALKNANADEFLSVFQEYVNNNLPILGFLLTKEGAL